MNNCIGDDAKPPLVKVQTAFKKIKYGGKRFSIWRMELWHPAMWHVAMGSWHWIHQVAAPCNVALGSRMTCHWIRQVAPCDVAHGSGIMTLNSPVDNTLQCDTWLWDDMPMNLPKRPIGSLLLVSISTIITPQSTCHSGPICEILSKSDRPRQKKITSCQFSRRRISAILDCGGPVIDSLKSPYTTSYRSSIYHGF